MFNDTQLENLRELRKSLTTPQIEFADLSGRPAPRARAVPKIREKATGGDSRPKERMIIDDGPSTKVTSSTWDYAPTKISAEDRKAQASGYYKGCRWSPAPGSRNWRKQPFAIS